MSMATHTLHRAATRTWSFPFCMLVLFACGERDERATNAVPASGTSVVFVWGDRSIRPNWHWNMEGSDQADRTSTLHAYSGGRSLHIGTDMEHGPSICSLVKDAADTLQEISTGYWLYAEEEDLRLTLVVTIHRGEEQVHWFGKDLRGDEYVPGRWQRFNASFPVDGSTFTGAERVCVHLWNREHAELFVDDWDVVFRSTRIPGRQAAPGIDLEQEGRTRAVLPFITVVGARRADPAAHGVQVGQLAPDPSTDPVALPGATGHLLHLSEHDAVGILRDRSGNTVGLLRAWHPLIGRDLFTFERRHLKAAADGVLIVAYDVDTDLTSGLSIVAAEPAPQAYVLQLDPLP
jgi:hypothetical protein